jgi:hypothetical protein
MSYTDPGWFVSAATATGPGEPRDFLPPSGEPATDQDQAASDASLATDPQPSRVDSAAVGTLGDRHPRPFDPFDDPCNYHG